MHRGRRRCGGGASMRSSLRAWVPCEVWERSVRWMARAVWAWVAFAGCVQARDSAATDALRAACDARSEQTLLRAAADSGVEARAVWLAGDVLRWPGVGANARFS